MYLVYVDESGSPYSYSPRSEFFILSAVIIPEFDWEKLNQEIASLKRKYFPSGDLDDIEVKGSDIWNAMGSFTGFDTSKIDQILYDICYVITQNNLKIVSIVVRKQKFIFQNTGKDMITESWKYLLERIEMFLTGEGQCQHGLIIMDSINHGEDKKMAKILDGFKRAGTDYVNLDHILEITFSDSGMKKIIQLTDVISYIVNLHMRKDTTSDIEYYWKAVETKFRRDRFDNYDGVGFKEIP